MCQKDVPQRDASILEQPEQLFEDGKAEVMPEMYQGWFCPCTFCAKSELLKKLFLSSSQPTGGYDHLLVVSQPDLFALSADYSHYLRQRKLGGVELVGIEPNPGPGQNNMGKKSQAETRMVVFNPTKQKLPKKVKQALQKVKRRTDVVSSSMQSVQRVGDYEMQQYIRNLRDPFGTIPVRLGGENMQPTGIATLSARGLITTAGGFASFVWYPWAQNSLFESPTAAAPYVYSLVTGFNFPGGPSLSAIAAEARIVSAAIRVSSVDNQSTNQGILTIGALPRNVAGAANNLDADGIPYSGTSMATQGYTQFYNYLQTESFPLRSGASCFWTPQDPLDFTFRDTPILSPSLIAPGSDLVPPIVFGIQGGASGGCNLMIELISHIEYTVSSGTTGVVSTGNGNMSTDQNIKAVRSAFQNAIDTAIEGVSGGFSKVAGGLITQAVNSAGAYASSLAAAAL
jgi:hypothetical protein